MNDKQDKSDDDRTEFHFSDMDEPTRLTPSGIIQRSGGGGFAGANKRKLVLLGIGSVVVVLLVFKVLEWFLSTPPSKPPASKMQTNVQQPVIQPVSAPVPQENARINNLVTDKYSENLEHLQEKVTQLESNLVDANTQLAAMNQTVQALSQQLQQQQAQLAKPTKPAKPVSPEKKPEVAAVPTYYIQAMVPGRAWLVNQKGTVTTVSVGDDLSGYGIITTIDLNQGLVITAQGKLISYHQDDR
jgi:intracellular multiplication protein IcmG